MPLIDRREKAMRPNLSMLCLRAILPSLVTFLFLFPHAAKADIFIYGTGEVSCVGTSIYTPDCADIAYTALNPTTLAPLGYESLVAQDTITEHAMPPPAGISYIPTGGAWDFPDGDSGICGDCGVFDWSTYFTITSAELPASCDTYADAFGNSDCEVTITGNISAEGDVAAAVDGSGGYLGTFSTAAATPFSLTVYAALGNNTLDFIFSGCDSYNPGVPYPGGIPGYCNALVPPSYDEPITALYVDPSSIATPGAPGVQDMSESVLVANGGVAPPSSAPTSVPESSSVLLLSTVLVSAGFFRAYRRRNV